LKGKSNGGNVHFTHLIHDDYYILTLKIQAGKRIFSYLSNRKYHFHPNLPQFVFLERFFYYKTRKQRTIVCRLLPLFGCDCIVRIPQLRNILPLRSTIWKSMDGH